MFIVVVVVVDSAELMLLLLTGFTDLNTQMGLDEGTLQVSTIPMLDLRTFAMRILFPGLQEHPVLHPVEVGDRKVA